MQLIHPNLLTISQAVKEGFGNREAIKKQLFRGALKGEKFGNMWVIHRSDLIKMQFRRDVWNKKRSSN